MKGIGHNCTPPSLFPAMIEGCVPYTGAGTFETKSRAALNLATGDKEDRQIFVESWLIELLLRLLLLLLRLLLLLLPLLLLLLPLLLLLHDLGRGFVRLAMLLCRPQRRRTCVEARALAPQWRVLLALAWCRRETSRRSWQNESLCTSVHGSATAQKKTECHCRQPVSHPVATTAVAPLPVRQVTIHVSISYPLLQQQRTCVIPAVSREIESQSSEMVCTHGYSAMRNGCWCPV